MSRWSLATIVWCLSPSCERSQGVATRLTLRETTSRYRRRSWRFRDHRDRLPRRTLASPDHSRSTSRVNIVAHKSLALSLCGTRRFDVLLHLDCQRSVRFSRQCLGPGASRQRQQPVQAFTPKVGGLLHHLPSSVLACWKRSTDCEVRASSLERTDSL